MYTGLKPGEKMSEVLSFSGEDVTSTDLEKLWVLLDTEGEIGVVDAVEKLLESLPELGEATVRGQISELVPAYKPAVAPDSGTSVNHGETTVRSSLSGATES